MKSTIKSAKPSAHTAYQANNAQLATPRGHPGGSQFSLLRGLAPALVCLVWGTAEPAINRPSKTILHDALNGQS